MAQARVRADTEAIVSTKQSQCPCNHLGVFFPGNKTTRLTQVGAEIAASTIVLKELLNLGQHTGHNLLTQLIWSTSCTRYTQHTPCMWCTQISPDSFLVRLTLSQTGQHCVSCSRTRGNLKSSLNESYSKAPKRNTATKPKIIEKHWKPDSTQLLEQTHTSNQDCF